MALKTPFAINLLSLRTSRNWSQVGAAKHIGISRSKYRDLENGDVQPNIQTVSKILQAYKIPKERVHAFLYDKSFCEENKTTAILK